MNQHSHFLVGLLLGANFPVAIVLLIFLRIMCFAA
jgi:hypothetical protein